MFKNNMPKEEIILAANSLIELIPRTDYHCLSHNLAAAFLFPYPLLVYDSPLSWYRQANSLRLEQSTRRANNWLYDLDMLIHDRQYYYAYKDSIGNVYTARRSTNISLLEVIHD